MRNNVMLFIGKDEWNGGSGVGLNHTETLDKTVSLSPYTWVMKKPHSTYSTNQAELQGMENRYY